MSLASIFGVEGVVATAELQLPEPTIEEIVELGAVDTEFFCRYFFPRTVRQESPEFHQEIWDRVEGPSRLVNIQVFRGGAKTTILRLYTAKRIAYGLAHTILYIGKSEGHAIRSVKWLKNQIERNNQFARVFGLTQGTKWQDVECEIQHNIDEYPIWIMAMGITGSIRGINQDDFRPDLIIIDDVIDEQNSSTVEQRQKIEGLIYGALKEGLAPASEAPHAKMVMLQTPLNREDASTKALKDPEWDSAVFGTWTPETADLSLDRQESAWPERWPSEVLRKEKSAAIDRNQLSIWLREKECKLISPETSTFREAWLQYFDIEPSEQMLCTLIIDPVPPPSEIQVAKGLRGKDYEALAVVGVKNGNYYLLDYTLNRGHEPDWTVAEFFRLALRWKPRRVVVEAVAYQRTLAWLLKKAMEHQRRYYVIKTHDDKRKKFDRIVDGLSGIASNGKLFIRPEHTEFKAQFVAYPDIAHDDLIEAVAIGCADLSGYGFSTEDDIEVYDDLLDDEKDIPNLSSYRGAP